MKNLTLRYELHTPIPSSSPIELAVSNGKILKHPPSRSAIALRGEALTRQITLKHRTSVEVEDRAKALTKVEVVGDSKGNWKIMIMGAIGVGILVVMSEQKALALGPEGPLVEEFWDNVRRYALYALSVSTGAIYTILLPIFELLKNPISAILIIAIFGGSIYIVSQVLSAMVGVSDFNYDYNY